MNNTIDLKNDFKENSSGKKIGMNSLTLKDIVNSTGKPPAHFGHTFYASPSNEMLMKKIPNGKCDKNERLSFIEKIQRKPKNKEDMEKWH